MRFSFLYGQLSRMKKTTACLIKAFAFPIAGILILGCVIVGCTQVASQTDRPRIEIVVSEPDRIRFSGKGAGAGMMMAGTMGPMGIAIGVAIDEGIGKDIDSTAGEGNVGIRAPLLEAAHAALDKPGNPLARIEADTAQIIVERYGFVTAPGDGDSVQPQLHISFLFNGDKKQTLRIPEDFKGETEWVFNTYPLDEIKTNAQTIQQAFKEVAEFAVNQALMPRVPTD